LELAHLDSPEKFQESFSNTIARTEAVDSDIKPNALPDHQYALKPVIGKGKIKLRKHPTDMAKKKAKASWTFALAVTKHEVYQRAYKSSWDYFRQRRDDRKTYIGLFKAVQQGTLPPKILPSQWN